MDLIIEKFGKAPDTDIRKNMLVADEQELLEIDESGYADIKINIAGDNGRMYEVQISTKAMLKAKDAGHQFYEDARSIDAAVMKRLGITSASGTKEQVRVWIQKGKNRREKASRKQLIAQSQEAYLPSFRAFIAASSLVSNSASVISQPSSSRAYAGTGFQPESLKNRIAPREALSSMATSPLIDQNDAESAAPESALSAISNSPPSANSTLCSSRSLRIRLLSSPVRPDRRGL